MFDIVLVCRRPSQLPPMSFQIFIAAAAAAATTRAAAAARSRAGCAPRSPASTRRRRTSAPAATPPPPPPSTQPFLDESGEPAVSDAVAVEGGAPVNHNYMKTTRMVRHPAALLLLSLRRLLSLLLPPRRRPGRSGAGLNCVLCTAIQTLQCQKQSDGERKYSNTDSDPPGRGRSKTM